MNKNPLPTLKAGDSHMESLIEAAIQGHADTRDAMRWLVRQLVPARQPAEVTDEREAFEAEMRCEDVWGHRSLKKRADGRYENWLVDLMWDVWQARSKLTIPALRPVQSTFCEYCGGNDEEPVEHCMDCTRPVQVPMTEWQPIETAPLAGPFLAVLDCGGDQTICTMRHGVVASKNSRPDGEFIRERVTHWMPLPPLPKSTYTGITAQAKKEGK